MEFAGMINRQHGRFKWWISLIRQPWSLNSLVASSDQSNPQLRLRLFLQPLHR